MMRSFRSSLTRIRSMARRYRPSPRRYLSRMQSPAISATSWNPAPPAAGGAAIVDDF